jgi:opacity protein-like surface antigen
MFFSAASATGDTLALVKNSVAGTVALETDADGTTKENGLYLRIGAGVNVAMDADVKNVSGTYATGVSFGTFSVDNTSVSFDPGFVFDIGIGIPVGEAWSIEIMTGIATNSVESISGNYSELDSVFGPFSERFSGGGGDLYQVPIVVNARYEFDLNDSMNLGLFAGGGLQYSDLEVNDSLLGNASSDVWSFRYQVGFDLTWDVASRTTLGLNVRYSGTTENDFGSFQGVDIKVDSFQNLAIGATFSYAF